MLPSLGRHGRAFDGGLGGGRALGHGALGPALAGALRGAGGVLVVPQRPRGLAARRHRLLRELQGSRSGAASRLRRADRGLRHLRVVVAAWADPRRGRGPGVSAHHSGSGRAAAPPPARALQRQGPDADRGHPRAAGAFRRYGGLGALARAPARPAGQPHRRLDMADRLCAGGRDPAHLSRDLTRGRAPVILNFIHLLVDFSRRFACLVTLLGVGLTAISAYYASTHLSLDTDIDKLLDPNLPWRKREMAYDKEFPQFSNLIVIVVDGATPDQAEDAAAGLREDTHPNRELL